MGQFDWAIDLAKELIATNGQPVKWRVNRTVAPIDVNKPWDVAQAAPVDHDVTIVFLPDNRDNRELIAYLRGTEVPKGRVTGLMAATSFDPAAKDTVLRNGVALSVECIDALAPDGNAILYTLEFAG